MARNYKATAAQARYIAYLASVKLDGTAKGLIDYYEKSEAGRLDYGYAYRSGSTLVQVARGMNKKAASALIDELKDLPDHQPEPEPEPENDPEPEAHADEALAEDTTEPEADAKPRVWRVSSIQLARIERNKKQAAAADNADKLVTAESLTDYHSRKFYCAKYGKPFPDTFVEPNPKDVIERFRSLWRANHPYQCGCSAKARVKARHANHCPGQAAFYKAAYKAVAEIDRLEKETEAVKDECEMRRVDSQTLAYYTVNGEYVEVMALMSDTEDILVSMQGIFTIDELLVSEFRPRGYVSVA